MTLRRSVSFDLGGWQAALALSQSKVSNPKFRDSFATRLDLFKREVDVSLNLGDLKVQIEDGGLDMISLSFEVAADIDAGGDDAKRLDGVRGILTTQFETQTDGTETHVVANLRHENAAVRVQSSGKKDVRALVAGAIEAWAKSRGELRLFSFSSKLGETAGMRFGEVAVTSTSPEFSPELRAFVLLMREAAGDGGTAVVDPHVLPNGEEGVLWLSDALIARSGGQAAVAAAEAELTLRPRYMGVQLGEVSDTVRDWAATVVDGVTIPGGLDFVSMEFTSAGLVLSATELSLDELDRITAIDESQGENADTAQPVAQDLFHKAMLYHMDAGLRKNLLQESKPNLPAEVVRLTTPQAKWYRKFGRLQVAKAIADSDDAGRKPFNQIQKKAPDRALRKMMQSPVYQEQTNGLYNLGFSVVRPRMSLYLDEAPKWAGAYAAHCGTQDYAAHLVAHAKPVETAQTALVKLAILDPKGDRSGDATAQIMGGVVQFVTQAKWKEILQEKPDQIKETIRGATEAAFNRARDIIDQFGSKPAGELTPQEKKDLEEAESVITVISTTAKIAKFANNLYAYLYVSQEAVDGWIPLTDEVANQQLANNPEIQQNAIARQNMTIVIGGILTIALAIVFFIGVGELMDFEGLEGWAYAERVVQLIGGWVGSVTGILFSVVKLAALALPAMQTSLVAMGGGAATFAGYLGRAGNLASGIAASAKFAACVDVVGGFLVLVALVGSMITLIKDWTNGESTAVIVVDFIMVASAILGAVAFAGLTFATTSWAGPLALVAAFIGLVVGLIRAFAFPDAGKSDAQKSAEKLMDDLVQDGVAAA